MSILKCKMCGGTIEINDNRTTATCEYCGTEQTLSKSREETIQNLFNRANNLRMKSEFDKAQEIYEKIVDIDGTDSEAYWGLVLCKYGIEYVEDPKTFKRVPTCHRTEIESVLADVDYKSAIENADTLQRAIYEAEAKQIDALQKDILKIANSEEPFDVFICYKETDADGKRTQDSVIANDIYYQLKNEGFKVFYAAITLEDKLGREYEPYIFAALNSAKVMLVVGTKPEYFSAVWVKNEWSRYLKLLKNDRSKLLIPCYKDMDAYELPEEFAHLQAQDMSKIGFINDVVRGIKKIVAKDEPKPEAPTASQTVIMQTAQSGNANTTALLKRGQISLEDGDFQKAKEFFDRVLDMDAECSWAYLGIYLADHRLNSLKAIERRKSLKYLTDSDYQRFLRFANGEVKELLEVTEKNIREQIRLDELEAERKKEEALRLEAEERQRAAEKKVQFAALREKIKPTDRLMCTTAGAYPFGIKSNGKVLLTSTFAEKYDVSKWNFIVGLAHGIDHLVGLRADGRVVTAGSNAYGECNVSDWEDIVAIAAYQSNTIGLKADGTIVATGEYIKKDCPILMWQGIVDICGSFGGIVALKSDGTAVSWSRWGCQSLMWQDVVSVRGGDNWAGLKSDGTVAEISAEENPGFKDVVSATAGGGDYIGLLADGRVVATGKNEYGECDVSEWRDIVNVYASNAGTIGLRADGTLIVAGQKEMQERVAGWKLFGSIETFEAEVEQMKETMKKCAPLEDEIRTLQKEYKGLGLFAGKRKKEIDARVTELKAKLEELIDTL